MKEELDVRTGDCILLRGNEYALCVETVYAQNDSFIAVEFFGKPEIEIISVEDIIYTVRVSDGGTTYSFSSIGTAALCLDMGTAV